jgi:hypothetical protein
VWEGTWRPKGSLGSGFKTRTEGLSSQTIAMGQGSRLLAKPGGTGVWDRLVDSWLASAYKQTS